MKKVAPDLQSALSFLTILPFPCPLVSERPAEALSRAMAWFPVAGALVGAAGGGVALWLSEWWAQPVAAMAGLALMELLTGGLHLDGFADTADGFGAWKGREETLRIMRDSRVGALGAGAIFFLLGFKWACLSDIPLHALLGAAVSACALSRMTLVLSAQAFPYAPGQGGLGRLVTDRRSPASVAAALALGLGFSVVCLGLLPGIFVASAAIAVAWCVNTLVVRRLGGITGDTLGAVSELVEAAVLFLAAMR